MTITIKWLNVYGHILDTTTVNDEHGVAQAQMQLPKKIKCGDEWDVAVGIDWYINRKPAGIYWKRTVK